MKNYIKYIILCFFFVSCIEEEAWEVGVHSGLVDVCLNLDIEMEQGKTKAVRDPEVNNKTQIQDLVKNLWVLQFDGTGDDAKLIGEPQYYADMSKLIPSSNDGNGEKVKLVRSTVDNRVVFLGNTFDPLMTFPKDSDFADLKKRWTVVTDSNSLLSPSEDGEYIIFNGSTEVTITDNVTISCRLKRNVAKLIIEFINTSSDVIINSWQLKSIPSVSYYYTNYSHSPAGFPEIGNFKTVDYPAFIPSNPLGPGSDTSSDPYIVYLPVNERGAVSETLLENQKNDYAPTSATYLQVNASYDDGVPIQYTFYLGENLTSDFNIRPNYSYSYQFNISAPGSAATDSRVKELGLVDFRTTELANCYVINPAQTEGVRRKFIIPVARVDEFWGNPAYGNSTNYTFGNSKPWSVKIVAANFDISGNQIEFTKSSGTGSNDYFEFTVAPNITGNAIVALYASDGQVCWSWHLWITKYSPDEAYLKQAQDGVYRYTVPGGEVHRYGWAPGVTNSIWQNEYASRFIMDRNLGAWNTGYNGNGNGTLYFQFGRKDPFFGDASDCYDANGQKSTVRNVFGVTPSSGFADNEKSVPSSIHNPLVMIYYHNPSNSNDTRGEWTSGNKYNPSSFDAITKTILWQDPQTASNGTRPGGKSIFDPCPPGYCVPKAETWADFRMNTANYPTTNVLPANVVMEKLNRNFMTFSNIAYYWPYQVVDASDDVPKEVINYPKTGFKDQSQLVGSYTGYLYAYSSNAASVKNGHALSIYPNSMSVKNNFPRNLAFPVRCVTSHDSSPQAL